jgi:argininosuccinate synthase
MVNSLAVVTKAAAVSGASRGPTRISHVPTLARNRLAHGRHFARQPYTVTVKFIANPFSRTRGSGEPENTRTRDVARDKVILAYSGGLDTSVAVKWINESYGLDVIAYTCDLGQGQDIEAIRHKALRTGTIEAIAEDVRNLFVDYFVFPSLMAGALYEGKYPLATALGRPLIAQRMVHFAREHGAKAVAHGCTGKGNDQVRFDVTFQTLAPDLKIIAPVREWKWTRSEQLAYAHQHGIALEAASEKIFSVDQNLWGRSVESGVLEDPWLEPPPEAFEWTADPREAPDEPEVVTLTFERGKPVALDDHELDGVPLIQQLNERAGRHGIGRIDHVENRLVGIKSRELYEAPAAVVLHEAHRELEFLTLSKDATRFKTFVSQAYADLIYNGLWFSALHQDLMAFVVSNQQYVSGTLRVKMFKGHCQVVGRKSDFSLYRHELATYEKGDQYDATAAQGFIKIHGLMQTTQAKHQMLKGPGAKRLELPSIIPPDSNT